MQFAICDERGKASLWCEQLSVLSDGRVSFRVLNGFWTGIYDPQKHEIFVDKTGTTRYGKLIWQGRAPFNPYHCEQILAWIDEQVMVTGGRIRDWIYVDDGEADYTEIPEVRF